MTEHGSIVAVHNAIDEAGGWLPFDHYLSIALHHPQHGYYGSGKVRFGTAGDFHTAPTLSPLFAETLAGQIQLVIDNIGGEVLEIGGGDGSLAEGLLQQLTKTNPTIGYTILETSPALRARQQQRLSRFNQYLQWPDRLPDEHRGIIIMNEVLDCVPFRLFIKKKGQWWERGIIYEPPHLSWQEQSITDENSDYLDSLSLPDYYQTEVSPQAEALVFALSERLQHGYLLIADYGFGQREYYHQQRTSGTMLCHLAHQVDDNPLIHVGEKDITTHINFTAIAKAGLAGGSRLVGYTTQAQALINSGITNYLQRHSDNITYYTRLAAGVNQLLAPHEMGELFKWIAFAKGEIPLLPAFAAGDKRHYL